MTATSPVESSLASLLERLHAYLLSLSLSLCPPICTLFFVEFEKIAKHQCINDDSNNILSSDYSVFVISILKKSFTLELEQWNRRSSTPIVNHNFGGPISAPGTISRSGGPSPSCSPGHSNNLGNSNINNVPPPSMLCGPPPIPPQNGPPMTMGPYNPGVNSIPHVMHHAPPHMMQHPGGPPANPNMHHGRHTPFYDMRQPENRVHEINKRLQQRSDVCRHDSDNIWWDAFASEFFEDDATLTVTFCLEDGPKRYSMCY
ncbi:LIM-domain binding protein-like protein [Sarcoptes scabiei]|uniref:LIM-domain binding protein-like protein n=1 Tax=Sarcoptes scabiei TaxID=52283 RepID=A0A131ZZH4_SARSC|nr:LIM-domain binding protein-like protein [Sarcoptes scabiei]